MTLEQKLAELEASHYYQGNDALFATLRRAIEQRNNWIHEAIMNSSDIPVQELDEYIQYHEKDDNSELLQILNG